MPVPLLSLVKPDVRNENTRQVAGRHLESHGLAASQLIDGREKNLDFIREMIGAQLLDREEMKSRIEGFPARSSEIQHFSERWQRMIGSDARILD